MTIRLSQGTSLRAAERKSHDWAGDGRAIPHEMPLIRGSNPVQSKAMPGRQMFLYAS